MASRRPSKKRAAIVKLDRGDVSGAMRGGKRVKKAVVKKKTKARPQTMRDLRMEEVIYGKKNK